MHFLGREPTKTAAAEGNVEEGGANERQGGAVSSDATEKHGANPYAGVVVFCVPLVTEIGRDVIDVNSFQVWVLLFRAECMVL